MGMMLLGSYDTDNPDTALVGVMADAGVRCVKVENSGKHMNYAAKRGMLTIGRNMASLEEPLEKNHIPPSTAAAQKWFYELFLPWVGQYGAYMKQVYFEGCYNEPGGLEDPAMRRGLNDFEVERQRLMHNAGYRCCIFNFSAEANVHDKITEFLPAIRLCAQYGNLFGQHTYGSPQLVDPETGVTDPAIAPFVFAEEWIAAELRRRGEPVPAFANTEHGIDRIISLGRDWKGWRTVPGLTGYEYFKQIVVTCQRKKRNGLVKAVNLFVDDTNPGGDWIQYNTHGGKPARPKQGDPGEPPVTLMLVDHHRAYSDIGIVVPSGGATAPPPDPTPDPGQPAPVAPYEAVVTVDGLNLRDGDSDVAALIKSLPKGYAVTVLNDGTRRAKVRVVIEGTVLRTGVKPK